MVISLLKGCFVSAVFSSSTCVSVSSWLVIFSASIFCSIVAFSSLSRVKTSEEYHELSDFSSSSEYQILLFLHHFSTLSPRIIAIVYSTTKIIISITIKATNFIIYKGPDSVAFKV